MVLSLLIGGSAVLQPSQSSRTSSQRAQSLCSVNVTQRKQISEFKRLWGCDSCVKEIDRIKRVSPFTPLRACQKNQKYFVCFRRIGSVHKRTFPNGQPPLPNPWSCHWARKRWLICCDPEHSDGRFSSRASCKALNQISSRDVPCICAAQGHVSRLALANQYIYEGPSQKGSRRN